MPRNAVIGHLKLRWQDSWNVSSHLIGPVAGFPSKIDDALARLGEEREQLVKSGHLTAAGLQDRLRKSAAASIVPILRKAKGELTAARSAVHEMRRKLTAPEIDKSDIAGALLRRELREYMRGLPDPDRMALLLQGDDPRIIAAYLEFPALVPLPAEVRSRIEAERIEKNHASEMRQIKDAEEAQEIVHAIVDTALGAVRQDLGFGTDPAGQKAFEAFVEASA